MLTAALCCSVPTSAGDIPSLLGLPSVTAPTDNALAARIALGRRLFFDQRLSRNGTIACASCHQPERAFADGLTTAKGIGGRLGSRNTPSLINVGFNGSQFWDGRRADLESQALDPFTNPREHGLSDIESVMAILRRDDRYPEQFQGAFPAVAVPISAGNLAHAIASYERTLIAGNSPFDQYYFKGERNALSSAAVRGLALFQGVARCASCHTIDKNHALFTDNRFHSLGVGLRGLASKLADLTIRLAHAKSAGADFDSPELREEDIAELGRFAVTLDPRDIGTFRTPSLRNVAETAPYMHNGTVPTLEEAVELEIYYRSIQFNSALVLTATEKADLVEFLKALSGEHIGR
jgi:cytochrome c peroxidase